MTKSTIPFNPPSSFLVKNGSNEPELKLCFEKGHFDRPDFTVDWFIHVARKRATLDQLQTDLRSFLRHIQSSMIELINDDYADFVNLSSNLAALKDNIEKNAWDGFQVSTTKIRQTAELVDSKCRELAENRQHQMATRNKIMLLNSIERLSHSLKKPSEFSLRWFVKLINGLVSVEMWQSRVNTLEIGVNVINAKEACFNRARDILIDALLSDLRGGCQFLVASHTALSLLGETNEPPKVVAKTVVRNVIDVKGQGPVAMLNSVYEQIRKLRDRWVRNLQIHNQFTPNVELFVDQSLLEYVNMYLDQNLSVLCLPSDTDTFFQSYKTTENFCLNYPRIEEHPAFLEALRDKYNAVVYVKRLTAPLREDLLAKTANTSLATVDSVDGARKHPFDASDVVLKAISFLYDEKHFLPVVANEFWQLTLSMVEKHTEWIDYVIKWVRTKVSFCFRSEPPKIVDEIAGTVTSEEKWPHLVKLVSGSKLFDSKLLNEFVTKVFVKFGSLGAEAGPFRQIAAEYSASMEQKREQMREMVVAELIAKASKQLVQVGDIPKQYRWTKKSAPTMASGYLNDVIKLEQHFQENAVQSDWAVEWIEECRRGFAVQVINLFLNYSREVLNSVKQTGTSLQRFKRKGISPSDSSSNLTMTDEQKILLQLKLDVVQVKEIAQNTGTAVDKLDDLLTSIQEVDTQ